MPASAAPAAIPSSSRSLLDNVLAGAVVVAMFLVAGALLLDLHPGAGVRAADAQIQFFALFAGLSVVFLTAAKYVVSRERLYLPLTVGFLVASLLDLAEPTLRSLEDAGVFGGAIPATTTAPEFVDLVGRLAFAGGLLLAATWFRDPRLDDRPGRRLVLGSLFAILLVLAAVFAIAAASMPAFYAARVGPIVAWHLLPLPLLAGAAYLLASARRSSGIGLRIVGLISVATAFGVQGLYLFITEPFGTLFFAARVLKVACYLIILFGLYLEHVRLYALERGLRESIESANVELKMAKTELDAIIEDLTDGVMVIDEAGKVVRFNRAAREIMGAEGLGTRPETSAPTVVTDLKGNPVTPDQYAVVRALRKGETLRGVELIVQRGDGEKRHVVAGAVPLRDARGRIRGAVAAFNDVTDIRQAEQRFRDLTEGAPDGIIVVDHRWRIVLFNRAAEVLFGYERDEVYGQDVVLLIPERLQGGHLKARDEFFRSGRVPRIDGALNVRGLRKDGSEIPVQVSVSASGSLGAPFFIAHVRDTTQLERVRREREGILSVALASTATVTLDDFLQRAAQAIVGATDFDVCTIYIHDPAHSALVLRGHAGVAEDMRAKIAQYPLDPNFPSFAVQTWFQRKLLVEANLEGRRDYHLDRGLLEKHRIGSLMSVPLGDEQELLGVLQVVAAPGRYPRRDDVQLMELLGHELLVGLRQKRLIQQLEHSGAELRHANEELDSFIYTASHDLAEPLRSISNFSHFLLEDYAGKLDDEGRDYLQRVHGGALRMKRLLDDLLRLSRHGRSRAAKVRVNVIDVLQEVRESLDATLRERKADLLFDDHMPDVVADRTSLVEVFVNLVGNGVKFNASATPTVEVRATRRDGMVEFRVIDNGIGVPAEHHARIFGLFTRLHTRKDYPGTGAGLAIVKKVIENHGGHIWVESRPEGGTVFFFTLPAAPATTSRLEVPEARPPAA